MIISELQTKFNLGDDIAVTSICSANKYVLKAAMLEQRNYSSKLLIESTSNQVDQFGGYTGMTPTDFVKFVSSIAAEVDYPVENIVFGGDHLGPNVWQDEPSESAMLKAEDQVKAYIKAGYRKIHLDTSFSLADDDKSQQLSPEIITKRAAQLCEAAEQAFAELNDNSEKPFYVIGTEVPIPGGAQENEESILVTESDDLAETIELSQKAFYERGLEEAWERVIAVVVQPGVEFSDSQVFGYNRKNAAIIKNKIEEYSNIVFEAHSTDYQSKAALTEMVQDHFGILKVGPWLTFAVREAIFALSLIEDELLGVDKSSGLRKNIDRIMVENPGYWKKHYHGSVKEIEIARRYSYSDRIRYYWTDEKVVNLLGKMLKNLEEVEIPNTLISQYLPVQYHQVMENKIKKNAESLIISKVTEVLNIYKSACGGIIEE